MNAVPRITEQLRKLEELLASPDIRRNPEALARLLADDFREFGGSGRIFDKRQIIDAVTRQSPVELWLDDFQAQCLAPDLALVTYRGNCKSPESEKVSHSLRSSIWINRNGQWQVLFHQGTPAAI